MWRSKELQTRTDKKNEAERRAAEDALMTETVKEGLKSMFRGSRGQGPEEESNPTNDDSTKITMEFLLIARDMSMSVDDVLMLKKTFDSFDVKEDGKLDLPEFVAAVKELLKMHVQGEPNHDRILSMCSLAFSDKDDLFGDEDGSGYIDFREFVQWYFAHGFSEELLVVSEDAVSVRKLSRTYHVSIEYVENIKKFFDECDDDKTGELVMSEFQTVLQKCLHVPSGCDISPNRVQYFWSQIDTDSSGSITFGEFLAWWLKYFDESQQSDLPFESFYGQIRRMGAENLDPPAYPSIKAASDDIRGFCTEADMGHGLQHS